MAQQNTYSYIESFVDLIIEDKTGKNIFNPQEKSCRFDIFYALETGERKLYFNPKSFSPKGYTIINYDHSIRIFLFIPNKKENYSYTYFSINGGELHEIKTLYKILVEETLQRGSLEGGSIIRDKIWLNNNLIWSASSMENASNEIIKVRIDI